MLISGQKDGQTITDKQMDRQTVNIMTTIPYGQVWPRSKNNGPIKISPYSIFETEKNTPPIYIFPNLPLPVVKCSLPDQTYHKLLTTT